MRLKSLKFNLRANSRNYTKHVEHVENVEKVLSLISVANTCEKFCQNISKLDVFLTNLDLEQTVKVIKITIIAPLLLCFNVIFFN